MCPDARRTCFIFACWGQKSSFLVFVVFRMKLTMVAEYNAAIEKWRCAYALNMGSLWPGNLVNVIYMHYTLFLNIFLSWLVIQNRNVYVILYRQKVYDVMTLMNMCNERRLLPRLRVPRKYYSKVTYQHEVKIVTLKENCNKYTIPSFEKSCKTVYGDVLQNFHICFISWDILSAKLSSSLFWIFIDMHVRHKWRHAILFSYETVINMLP